MLDRQKVRENDWVMRYLRGELSVAEQAEFEQFYLNDPQTLDELEAASALKTHLPAASTPVQRPRVWLAPVLSAVGGLLVGVVLLLPFGTEPPVLAQPNIRTVIIDAARGADTVLAIEQQSGEQLIILRIPIASSEDRLRLSISRGGNLLYGTDQLRSDYMGDVQIALPLALLGSQPAQLVLSRPDGTVLVEEQIRVK